MVVAASAVGVSEVVADAGRLRCERTDQETSGIWRNGYVLSNLQTSDSRCTGRDVCRLVRTDRLAGFVQQVGKCRRRLQRTFASPAEAGSAFLEAAKSGDQGALLAIFGPDGKDALFSGDAVKDKNALQDFVAAYTPDESLE